MATEIYIGATKADYNESVNVEFSCSDFREFNSGNNNTSYTIQLPLTALNKSLLKFSNNLSSLDEITDTGIISVNGTEIIRGKITVILFSKIYASILIEKDSWINRVQNGNLKDLDFSALIEDYTAANMITSWAASPGAFIRYPMVNYGKRFGIGSDWIPNDFLPWFNLYSIIEKILYPISIESDFLTDTYFKSLYLRFNESIKDADFLTDKAFSASPTNYTDNYASNNFAVLSYAKDPVVITKEAADEASAFNTGTYKWTCPESGTYKFRFTANGRIFRKSNTVSNFSRTVAINSNSGILVTDTNTSIPAPASTTWQQIVETDYIYLASGDTVWAKASNSVTWTALPADNPEIYLHQTSVLEVIPMSDINLHIGINYPINATDWMPDIKQLDLLSAVKSLFNLRFFYDQWRNKMIIEPFGTFITSNIKDISSSIDFTDISVQNIAGEYTSLNRIEYLSDENDKALSNYNLTNKSTYGRKEIELSSVYSKIGITTNANGLFSNFITALPQSGLGYPKQVMPMIYKDYQDDTYVKTVTVTVTGASGTGYVIIEGNSYALSFASSIATTLSNWLSSFSTALSLLGIRAYVTPETIVLTKELSGIPMGQVSFVEGSGLSGSVVQNQDTKKLFPTERIESCNIKIGKWEGLQSGTGWTFAGTSKTQYPLMTDVDIEDIYSDYFQKFFHFIDSGKIVTLSGPVRLTDLMEFSTVLNDSEQEGFRTLYKFQYQGEYHLGILNKYTTDGITAKYELLIVK